jgi:hypothetical protein
VPRTIGTSGSTQGDSIDKSPARKANDRLRNIVSVR